MSRNVVEEVNERIKNLKEKKASELLSLQIKIDEAEQAKAQAENEMAKAIENTELSAYTEAKNKKADCAAAVEMFTARYNQLQAKEFVSEADSDAVIDSIKAYEEELSAELEKDVKPLLQKLAEINKVYKDKVFEAEQTMKAWTSDIHANYRSSVTTFSDGSKRSERPVPVRNYAYLGNPLSERLYHFLSNEQI